MGHPSASPEVDSFIEACFPRVYACFFIPEQVDGELSGAGGWVQGTYEGAQAEVKG